MPDQPGHDDGREQEDGQVHAVDATLLGDEARHDADRVGHGQEPQEGG
jgi:hypothetical protein